MIQVILAYIILIFFFFLEALLRKSGTAKSVKGGQHDQRSTKFIGLSFFVVIIASILLNIFKPGSFHHVAFSIVGLVMMISGLALRIWSMTTLSNYYTRTLIITTAQTLVRNGPYRIIRHPGYLGTILIWIGAGLAMQNLWLSILSLILFSLVYYYRILNEERMLSSQFGDAYAEYAKHSWRLIPWVW